MNTIITIIVISLLVLTAVAILYPIIEDRISSTHSGAATIPSALPSFQPQKYNPFASIPDPTEAPTFRVFRILNCKGDEQFIILSKGFEGTEFATDESDIEDLAKFFGIDEHGERSYIFRYTKLDFDDIDLNLSFKNIVAYSNFRYAFDAAQLLAEMQLASTWHIDQDFDPSTN